MFYAGLEKNYRFFITFKYVLFLCTLKQLSNFITEIIYGNMNTIIMVMIFLLETWYYDAKKIHKIKARIIVGEGEVRWWMGKGDEFNISQS